MTETSVRNPYPGLRAFEASDSQYFFGREMESRQLTHLIVAHRVVLLYSQSGAGKTSLLKAGVTPRLQADESRIVLPITRAGGSLPPGVDGAKLANVFVFNTLYGLASSQVAAPSLGAASLLEGLRPFISDEEQSVVATPRLLILDQFEEVFTNYPERRAELADFFRQLQVCLREAPQLSLLLSMREDYIAELDPYTVQLPDRLRTRFRLERLNVDSALAAVRGPAERADRPFEDGVAEALVDDLRRLESVGQRETGAVPGANGTPPLGEYVEPVYLQIVCRQLWDGLPAQGKTIRQEDVQSFGDVDEALVGFYRTVLAAVQEETGIPERRLRLWIERQMITPAGTRALLYRGAHNTGDLPNETADGFYDRYLIRRLMRGADIYYELAHDRLVFPVRNDNAAWLRQNQNALLSQAELWRERGGPPDLLLRGDALAEAERWAESHESELTEPERDFLRQSREARADAERDARQAKRVRVLAAVAGLLALVFAAALLASLYLLATVREQQQLSLARQLAAQSATYRGDQLDLSLLLSAEADWIAGQVVSDGGLLDVLRPGRVLDTTEARGSLLTALQTNSPLITYLRPYSDTSMVSNVAFASEGPLMATGDGEGRVLLWDPRAQPMQAGAVLPDAPADITALAFGPGDKWLAAGGRDGDITVWRLSDSDAAGSAPIAQTSSWSAHQGQVGDLAFVPDSDRVTLISAGKTSVALWDLTAATPEPLGVFADDRPIYSMALSPGGETLATGHEGVIQFWDMTTMAKRLQNGEMVTAARRYPVPDGQIDALAYGRGPAGGTLAAAISPIDRRKQKGADGETADVNVRPIVALLPLAGPGRVLAPLPDVDLCADSGGRCKVVDEPVRSLAFGKEIEPDGETALLAAAAGRSILVWRGAEDADRFSRSEAQTLVGHRDQVLDVAFDAGGGRLASGAMDGMAIMWEPAAPTRLAEDRLTGPARPHILRQASVGPAGIFASAYSPDGRWLLTGGEARATQLWDLTTHSAITLTDMLSDTVRSVAFSPNGDRVAAAKENGLISLWDLTAGAVPAALTLEHSPGQPAISVAFDQKGEQLASGGFDGSVRIWDLRASPPVSREIGTLPDRVFGVLFSPDGQTLSAVGTDGPGGRLQTWGTAATGSAGASLAHDGWLVSLAASVDGHRLAAGSDNGDIRLWDQPAQQAALLPSPANAATLGLTFSPASPHLLAAGNSDGDVTLWDTSVRRPVGVPLRGHAPGKAVDSVSFRPDGMQLASTGDDQAIVLWNLDPIAWRNRACQVANRNLTQDEWTRYFGAEPYRKTCPDLP